MARFIIAWIFVCSHLSGSVNAESLGLCDGIKHNVEKSHVQIDVDWVPNLKFFKDKRFSGEPSLVLNDEGLFFEKTVLCSWPQASFQKTIEPNRVLGFDGEKIDGLCPTDVPVKSAFGDFGKGTAVLCVELNKRVRNIVEVRYKGIPYYLDLKSIPKDKWKIEPPTGRKDEHTLE